MDEYQKASREYLLSLLTTIKKTRRALEQQETECEKWSRRLKLAEENQNQRLTEEAGKRLTEAEETKNRLKEEEQQVLKEFREAQTQYDIESEVPEKSLNPEKLLQSLYAITGEPDNLHDELNASLVEEELAELKRKMKEE